MNNNQNQSLQQIIDELPQGFINQVMTETDTAKLNTTLKFYHNDKKRAVIKARIQNINYLIA